MKAWAVRFTAVKSADAILERTHRESEAFTAIDKVTREVSRDSYSAILMLELLQSHSGSLGWDRTLVSAGLEQFRGLLEVDVVVSRESFEFLYVSQGKFKFKFRLFLYPLI